MQSSRQYAAFLSYAHADEVAAQKIQTALETFNVPRQLKAQAKAQLNVQGGSQLSPIFRDVTELTAHHSLPEKIQNAVKDSRFLIVLCSPAARTSHWVNAEIRLFRRIHGDSRILCALIEGTPGTSFPPALTEGGVEPLAADMSGQKERFRFGITQIAAAMLGVGLDELVQRERRRRQRRVRLIIGSALVFAAVMGLMSWTALDARNAAERNRAEAETMVEFILSDLRNDLETIGQLDVLDKIGDRVSNYYYDIPLSDMDDSRLAQQARALHLLGDVAMIQGNMDKARNYFEKAYATTLKLFMQMPDNPVFIRAHAQSELWMVNFNMDQPDVALIYAQRYKDLSQALHKFDPSIFEDAEAYAWAINKLGQILQKQQKYAQAKEKFLKALGVNEAIIASFPDKKQALLTTVVFKRNLALIDAETGLSEKAAENFKEQITILEGLLSMDPANIQYMDQLILTKLWLFHIEQNELQICSHDALVSFASQLETIIAFEPSNTYWTQDYIKLIYGSLKHCASIFEAQWIEEKISTALELAQLITDPDDSFFKKKAWLEQYTVR